LRGISRANGPTKSFKYDPFGRRIEKISPTTTSIFAYDGDNLIETVNGSGGEVASYAQGQNIDQPLAMDRSGTIDYYEQDGLGSVTSLTASNGSIAQNYTYDSFGNTTNSSGSLTNFFRYTGREFDTETNLDYYRARYYDPNTGRFVDEDPVDFDGGTNFYDYVANDPVTLFDPWGLWHCVASANCNFTPPMKKNLDCFDKCTGGDTAITSGVRPPSPKHPNSSHSRGEACDIGRKCNPNLGLDKAKQCFFQCFPGGYGQEECNAPDSKDPKRDTGTHFHFQYSPVPGGKPGFANGTQPYNP
jgi:RHS repeat-associated protein